MSDEISFEKLFRDNYKWVVALLLRRFRMSRERAEDTAQEAFCRVFPKWATIRDRPIAQRRAYLLTAAIRIHLNFLRDQRIEMPFDESLDSAESQHLERASGTAPPSSEERLIETEERGRRRARLAAAIDRLPHRQREVVLLRLRGLSYKEIASLLGTSEDAVKGALRDGRQSLRALLRKAAEEATKRLR